MSFASKRFGTGYNFPGFSEPSSKPILVWDPDNPASFLALSDTLASYSGHAGKAIVVNTAEDGLTVSSIVVASDKNHIHVQTSASVEWVVSHALAKFPAVSVVDSSGHVIITDIEYISNSEIRIHFLTPTAGTVYLN
jgi:hypothetical protein